MTEESTDLTGGINRRGFLGTGAGALAAAATLGDGPPAAAQVPPKTSHVTELAKRPLGRTGVQVSILSLGTWLSPGASGCFALPGPMAYVTSTQPRAMAPSR